MRTVNQDYLEKLERALMDLGAEIYALRSESHQIKESHDHILDVMKGLKGILDEKGLIHEDDFDNAVDLGKAITSNSFEGIEAADKNKKSNH